MSYPTGYPTLATAIDNAETTLGSPYVAGSGVMVVTTGTGTLFGSPTTSAPVTVYAINGSTVSIYSVTHVAGDTLTVAIAYGTTDRNFPAGASLGNFNGAEYLNDLRTYVQQLQADSVIASNLTSGTVPTARLGSGTASSTTFLRGDQTWSSGVAGSQGAQGYQGQQGPQGYQGLQGTAGANGSQGTQGFQGAIGTGTQGPQGYQGYQGSSGVQGAQGSQGAQGATGAGSQGFQGQTGPQGSVGAQGSQGSGLVVGGSISGSTTNEVLYVNASGNLAQSSGMSFSNSILSLSGLAIPGGFYNTSGGFNCPGFYFDSNGLADYYSTQIGIGLDTSFRLTFAISSTAARFATSANFTPFAVNQNGVVAASGQTSATPLTVQGSSGQTNDLTTWENSSGTGLSSVDANGYHRMVSGSGAPSSTPGDGALYVDTTNNYLYVRTGGAWKKTALS